jgi:hypothetical protein
MRWFVAGLVALTVSAAACGSSDDSNGTSGTDVVATPAATPPYYCNAVGTGTPPSGHGNGNHVASIYEGRTKGPLSDADCAEITKQYRKVIKVTRPYDTRAKAEAAGWKPAAEYVEGLGTHHTNGSIIPTETDPSLPFDPAKPDFLIYGGRGGDAPLMGVAYTYLGPGEPSEGYAGDNDWWHEHTTVCMAGVNEILAGAETIPDAECAKLGGFNARLTGKGGFFGEHNHFYMLHVWLPPHEYKPDIFVSGNPCLLETGLAPKSDPCWAALARDPSLGPPPRAATSDHGSGEHDMRHDMEHTATT